MIITIVKRDFSRARGLDAVAATCRRSVDFFDVGISRSTGLPDHA